MDFDTKLSRPLDWLHNGGSWKVVTNQRKFSSSEPPKIEFGVLVGFDMASTPLRKSLFCPCQMLGCCFDNASAQARFGELMGQFVVRSAGPPNPILKSRFRLSVSKKLPW